MKWKILSLVALAFSYFANSGIKLDADIQRRSLISAGQADHTLRAEMLIRMGADVNSRTSANGWSALHYAVRNGNPKVVQLLLKDGADPNYAATMEGQFNSVVSEKPIDLARAALDLVNQVPPTKIEATLRQGGLNDPALVKSMRDKKASERYQKVVQTLTKVTKES
jgi:ankyrin repeat protein